MASNARSEQQKSPSRRRSITNSSISSFLRSISMVPDDGVVPPPPGLSHNSTRSAPPFCAFNADSILYTTTSVIKLLISHPMPLRLFDSTVLHCYLYYLIFYSCFVLSS